MLNPCHPSEALCDDLHAAGLTVTEVAERRGCTGTTQGGPKLRSGALRQPMVAMVV